MEILSGRIGQCAAIEIQSSRAARLTSEVGLSGTWGDRIYTARDVHDARMGRATLVASDCKELGRRRSTGNIQCSVAVIANANSDFIDVDGCSPADAHASRPVRADFERCAAVPCQGATANIVARTTSASAVANRHPSTEAHRSTGLRDLSDAAVHADEHIIDAIERAASDAYITDASGASADLERLCAAGTINSRESRGHIQITRSAVVSNGQPADADCKRAAIDQKRARAAVADIGASRSGCYATIGLDIHRSGARTFAIRAADGQRDVVCRQINERRIRSAHSIADVEHTGSSRIDTNRQALPARRSRSRTTQRHRSFIDIHRSRGRTTTQCRNRNTDHHGVGCARNKRTTRINVQRANASARTGETNRDGCAKWRRNTGCPSLLERATIDGDRISIRDDEISAECGDTSIVVDGLRRADDRAIARVSIRESGADVPRERITPIAYGNNGSECRRRNKAGCGYCED